MDPEKPGAVGLQKRQTLLNWLTLRERSVVYGNFSSYLFYMISRVNNHRFILKKNISGKLERGKLQNKLTVLSRASHKLERQQLTQLSYRGATGLCALIN